MTQVALSPRARADLEEIWTYTATNWGIAQAESYTRQIQAAVTSLAVNPRLGKACDDVRRGYRRHIIGSHVIFYRVRGDTIEVMRFLHRRMDFARHL